MNDVRNLIAKYAVVTGGAAGLGRAFCLELARGGWRIAIVDIDRNGAEETRDLVEQAGGQGRVEMCDVTEPAAWRSLVTRLRADWPRLDLLVNNAGMFASGQVGALRLAEVERIVRLNLLSVLYGCDVMIPWLTESAAGNGSESAMICRPHIINVASVFAHVCPPGMAVYNMTKGGVVALSETLHGELRPRKIGVTVVCPGVMPTRFVRDAIFDTSEYQRMVEARVRETPLSPEGVARAAIRGMECGELYVVEGRRDRWYWRLKRLLPRTFLKQVARQIRRELRAQSAHPGP